MPIKFLVFLGRGGGWYFGFWGARGKCQFYFYGREDFSDKWKHIVLTLIADGKTAASDNCKTKLVRREKPAKTPPEPTVRTKMITI